MDNPIRLAIIVGSTRPARIGPTVADWFASRARRLPGLHVDLADLADVALPFLDEPEHPALARYTQPHTIAWSRRMSKAEAFVLVTPEYNASFPAPLKNALDALHGEWAGKPVGFVGYGGSLGGARALHSLRPVVCELGMLPVGPDVTVHRPRRMLDEDGVLRASSDLDDVADLLLTGLDVLAATLRQRQQLTRCPALARDPCLARADARSGRISDNSPKQFFACIPETCADHMLLIRGVRRHRAGHAALPGLPFRRCGGR